MTPPFSMLVTSEMMRDGVQPLVFVGGACTIQEVNGPQRNAGRDPLARWLDGKGWTYFDPQIHPSTHGRDYVWELDGPNEKQARFRAKLRVYEIVPTTICSVSMLEIMDDARQGRPSIVWLHGSKSFAPPGLGDRDTLLANDALRQQVGDLAFRHLVAFVKAGVQLRKEVRMMLADCEHVFFVDSLAQVQAKMEELLPTL